MTGERPHSQARVAKPAAQQLEDERATRLVIRRQLGDQSAFVELYELYFERIFAYVCVALRDRHEAEDIAQDTFVSVLRLLPRFEVRPDKPFRVLLFRIARNRAVDHLRKHGVVDIEPPERMQRHREAADMAEADRVVERLADGDLAIFVRRLPSSQRQVIALRYALDFGTDEIAEVMETTPQAVRNLQHRAFAFLRERLAEWEREPPGAGVVSRSGRRGGLMDTGAPRPAPHRLLSRRGVRPAAAGSPAAPAGRR